MKIGFYFSRIKGFLPQLVRQTTVSKIVVVVVLDLTTSAKVILLTDFAAISKTVAPHGITDSHAEVHDAGYGYETTITSVQKIRIVSIAGTMGDNGCSLGFNYVPLPVIVTV